MDPAKQAALEQLMGLMDDQTMSRFKKKPAPGAPPLAPAGAPPTATAAAAPESDEMDPESLQKLMQMYGKDQEGEIADPPASVTGSY